jgi:hypothetical protein
MRPAPTGDDMESIAPYDGILISLPSVRDPLWFGAIPLFTKRIAAIAIPLEFYQDRRFAILPQIWESQDPSPERSHRFHGISTTVLFPQ